MDELNQDKDKSPKKDTGYKPRTSDEIFNDIYKEKEKLTPTFKPGIGTNIDINKATEDLGTENRPELGTQYLQENIQKAESQKIYDEAKKKADDQGFFGEVVGFAAQATAGAVGGTLEGIGTLLDLNMVNTMEEDGQSLGKTLTEFGTQIKETAKENAPIYVNPEAEKAGFAPWSREWWLSGTADTVGSVLGFLIPVAGEAKLISTAGQALKGISTLGKVGKLGNAGRKTFNLIDNVIAQAPEITSGQKWALDGVHKAVVSRQMESTLEAKQVFDSEYKKLVDSGMSEGEARAAAGDAAAFTYRANWAMLITDIPQYLMLARGPKMSKVVDSAKLAQAAGLESKIAHMNAFKAYALNMGSEAGEEAYQFIVSEEGKHMADVQAGLAKDTDFGDRLSSYAKEAELWSSAFFGALGGGIFHAAGPKIQEGVNKYLLKNTDNYMDETTARIQEITNRKETVIKNVVARKQAVESGDEDAIKAADRQMSFDIGVNAAKVGNLDLALNGFDQLKNSSEEERKSLGLDETFITNIDEHKQNIQLAADLWQDNVRRYGEEFATPIAMREFNLHHLNKDLPIVKKTVDDLLSDLPRWAEISPAGKQAMEAKLNIKGNERTLGILNWKLKNLDMPSEKKEGLKKQIDTLTQGLDNSKEAYESTVKEFGKQFNDADNLILKSLDGKRGEDLAKAKSTQNLYNNEVSSLTEELNFLTSKAGQEAIKNNLKKQAEEVLKKKKETESKAQADQEEMDLAGQETTSAISLQELEDMIQSGSISESDLDEKSKAELKAMRENKTPVAKIPEAETKDEDINLDEDSKNLTRDIKNEVKTNSQTANTDDIYEVPSNPSDIKDLWFGDDNALNVALKTPNSLAWKSAYNTQSSEDTKNDPFKKALSDFLEGPYDLSNITVEFEIDQAYLHSKKYKSYREILDSLASKRVPEHIGELPVKAKLMRDGKQINHEGFDLYLHLHDDIYQNFDESIKEEAIRQIREQKTQIVKAFFSGHTLTSKIINKSNGHINTQIDQNGKLSKNSLKSIFSDPTKVEFSYGSNGFHLSAKKVPILDLPATQVTNGAIYAKVKTANGNSFPLRLHVEHLTRDEAYVIYKMFNEVVQDNNKLSENIAKEYIDGITNAKNPVLNQVPTYLDLNNITYKELLNHFVFNGFDKTKNAGESKLYLIKEGQSVTTGKIPSKVIFGEYNMSSQLFATKTGMEKFIKHLQENRRRQVDVSLLDNPAYKKYLINNNILTSNAVPNEKGRLFAQPTIAYSPDLEVKKEEKVIPPKTSPLPKNNEVQEEYSDEVDSEHFDDSETSILSAMFPQEKTPDGDSAKENPEAKAKEPKETPEDIKEKRRQEALKRKRDGKDSAFKSIISAQIDEKQDISGKEITHVRNILPKHIGLELVEDYVTILNNGEFAIGMFVDNMTYLSLKGTKGTGYHEAFHAIFRSSLTDNQQNILYSEAEERFGFPSERELQRLAEIYNIPFKPNSTWSIDDSEIKYLSQLYFEEQLADEFPLFMDGQSVYNKYSPGIKGWFQKLKQWLKNVFNSRITVNKLFRDIKLGKYKNSSKIINRFTKYGAEVAYKTVVTLPVTGDTFTPEEIKEITQQLTFAALKDVTNIDEINKINTSNVEDELYNLIAIAVEKNDSELEDRANKVLNNFTYFVNEIKNYLQLLDLEESEELIEDEEGNQIPKSSYEVSGKQNATKNIKFLIALTPKLKSYNTKTGEREYDTKGTYLGLPRFADFGNTWNKLERHLSGIVPIMRNGALVDSFDLMTSKLESLVKYHPELGYIKDTLQKKDFATKTQFHYTFSRYKGNYIDHLISGSPGQMISKIASSDAFKKEKAIADLWAYNFSKKMGVLGNNGLVYSPTKIEAFKNLYATMRRSLAKDSVSKTISTETLQLLDNVLDSLGINVSMDSLKKWMEEEEIAPNVEKGQEIIAKVNNFVFRLDQALTADKTNSLFNRRGPLNSYTNHILDQKFFHTELAGHEAEFQKVSGESTIIGPEGNKIWTYQDNNLISKTIAKINSGDRTHVDEVLGTSFGKNSLWAKWLKDEKNKLSLSIYGNYKEEGTGDSGDKASNLKEPDKLNDIVNKYLKGVFVGLAEADKSQQYYFEGPQLQKSQVSVAPATGQIFYENSNANSVKILTNYFADEVNRMIHAFNQLHGETKLKPEDQIMYYHYAKTPGDGKGNCFKSYLFPNMDLKAMDIMDEFGMPRILKDDNVKVKAYIEQAFLILVKKDLNICVEYGIISKDGNNYTNRTIDVALLNTKYDGNVVKAIADYTLNSIITNVEQCKLFNGDPALYKWKGDGFEDFRKRIPAGVASGKDIRIFKDRQYEVRSHYMSATVDNIITPSKFFADEENLRVISKASGMSLAKVRDIFKSYSEVNQTDAQAWITLDAFRERSIGYGKWNDQIEEAYLRMKEGKELPEDNYLFTQSLKTVHAELKNHHGVLSMQYNKQSEAVLLPMFKKSLKIGKLLEAMEAQKIDHVVVLDGKKAGAIGVTRIDKDGELLEPKDIKLNGIPLSYSNLFLQQDLPTKQIKDTQVGSQPTKNVLATLDLNEDYDGLSGQQLLKDYHETISKLSDLGLIKIKKELGFDEKNNKLDTPKFYKALLKAFNTDNSSNILNALKAHIPLDAIPQKRKQIQNKLNAMVTKKAVKLKQLGGALIQVSNFGFVGVEVDLGKPVQNGIIWFKNPTEELQPARLKETKDGNIKFKAAQILMPFNVMTETLAALKKAGVTKKDYKEMTHEEIKALISPDVLKGLSYRIPNQGPASNDVFQIVGILPEEMGDTMVAFKEITTKTGSDFDIDKSYIILPNFKYNEVTGKIERLVDTTSEKGLQNKRLELMQKLIEHPKAYLQSMAPIDDPWLKNLATKLYPETTSKDDLFFFTGTNQMKTKSLFDNAKNLVGVIANHMTNHNLTKHEDLYYTGYYLGLGPKKKVTHYNLKEDKEINVSAVSVEKDESGNLVEITLGAYMNAIVDAAKDPFISRANINQFTAPTAFMLARAGVDREWITAFMGQPILVELVNEMSKTEGRISEDVRDETGRIIKALDKILDKYGYGPDSVNFLKQLNDYNLKDRGGDILTEFSDLANGLKGKGTVPQLNVLGQFLEWQGKAKDLTQLIKACKADVVGATKNLTSATLQNNLVEKIIRDDNISNIPQLLGAEFVNGDIIFNGKKMTGTYHRNSVQAVKEMFGDLFMTETPAFNASLFNVATNAGYAFLQDLPLADTINDELYTATMSDSPVSYENKELLKKLLYGKSAPINWGEVQPGQLSLAERLLAAKDKDIYKENNLIQSLDIKPGNYASPSLIYLSPKNLDKDAKDNLFLAWEEVLELDKELGEDLIKYAFYSSGFKQNFGVFFEHIPTSWLIANGYVDSINKKMKEFSNPLALSSQESQIFKHLYKNNRLVPNAPGKVMKQINNIPLEYAFALNSWEAKELVIGINNKDNNIEMKRFLKRTLSWFDSNTGKQYENQFLYQLAGYLPMPEQSKEARQAIYVRTNTLGYAEAGLIIKEYGGDGNTSIFPENNVTLPKEVEDLLGQNLIYPERVYQGNEIDRTELEKRIDDLNNSEDDFNTCINRD